MKNNINSNQLNKYYKNNIEKLQIKIMNKSEKKKNSIINLINELNERINSKKYKKNKKF
jgi:hypothetical protein